VPQTSSRAIEQATLTTSSPAEPSTVAALYQFRPAPDFHRLAQALAPVPNPAGLASVRIYRPAANAMQGGRAQAKSWVLEFEPRFAPQIEPLMGWTSSRDTLRQVRLRFSSLEEAVAFAERQGWSCSVSEPQKPKFQPKSYADNFRRQPPARDEQKWLG